MNEWGGVLELGILINNVIIIITNIPDYSRSYRYMHKLDSRTVERVLLEFLIVE